MKLLYQVIHFPRGSDPRYALWHHLWISLWLTALGLFLGALTMPLAANAYSSLAPQDLMAFYYQTPMLYVLNLLPAVLLIWLFYFLSGRCWLAYLLTALPVLGIGAANFFKIQLRGDPLLAADLTLVSEAGKIVGHYSLEMTPLLLSTLLWAVAGLLFALFLLPRRMRDRGLRLYGLLSVGSLCGVAFLSLYCNASLYQNTSAGDDLINPWSDTESFVSHGVLYPFLYSVQDMLPTPPHGYRPALAQAALAPYSEADIPEERRVNVVGIMLEAFCDLTDFPLLASQPGVQAAYEPWHALEETSVSGDLLTNIFAGGTVDSEWGFLTGYSQHERFRGPVDSYVWYFDRQGYQTRGGHPGYGWFYNRQNVNRFLGFEEYWFTENYYGALVNPVDAVWNSDDLMVDEIGTDLRHRLEADGRPVFSFSVTYQNHGPYEWTSTAYQTYLDPEISGLSEETCHVFNNYLHGVENTIYAMVRLTRQLEDMEEPVVLVLFGDHKPWGGNGNSAYEGAGVSFDTSTLEGYYNYYSTPYLIWANSAAKKQLDAEFVGDGGDLSPCFLMPKLFELCGWEGPAFLQLSSQVMEQVPMVSSHGVYLHSGELTDTLPEPAHSLVQDFLFAQYYRETRVVPTSQPSEGHT